jgi:hypothetical protein
MYWTIGTVQHRLKQAAASGPGMHVTEALHWLDWLHGEDAALVQARLEGARWKMICWRFGISRPTAYRRWRYALGLIAWRLNGNALPTRCSRRRFMQLADRR